MPKCFLFEAIDELGRAERKKSAIQASLLILQPADLLAVREKGAVVRWLEAETVCGCGNQEKRRDEKDGIEENLLCSFFLRESERAGLPVCLGPPHSLGIGSCLATNQVLEYARPLWLLRQGPLCDDRQPSSERETDTRLPQRLVLLAVCAVAVFPFVPSPSPRPAFPTCCACTRCDRVRRQRIFWAMAGSFHPPLLPIPVPGVRGIITSVPRT